MSDKTNNQSGAGYGHPPKSGQFKKGQSGNPKGRPKKKDPSIVDLSAILKQDVEVNGELMDVREAEIWRQVEKALKPGGPLKSIKYLIELFEEYDAMKPAQEMQQMLELPKTTEFPWAVQEVLIRAGKLPPWNDAQLNWAKTRYLNSRDEGDRIHDRIMGHEQWLTK